MQGLIETARKRNKAFMNKKLENPLVEVKIFVSKPLCKIKLLKKEATLPKAKECLNLLEIYIAMGKRKRTLSIN